MRPKSASLVVLTLCLLLPAATAQSEGAVDFTVDVPADSPPTYGGPSGLLTYVMLDPGERIVWNISTTADYTSGEFRLTGFDIERPRQLVPMLDEPGKEYNLFEAFPNRDIWDVDGPARVFVVFEENDTVILRLGFPGPMNGTLTIARDITPPNYTIDERQNLTHRDFYQETHTDELAIANVEVRKAGTSEWVQNPTPVFHFFQRFPIQGLDANTDYEEQVTFTDWAGNSVTSPIELFRTLAAPVYPKPTITPLTPLPNATVHPLDFVIVSAFLESNESPVEAGGVRLFFDLKEVTADIRVENGVVKYAPSKVDEGLHVVTVEVTNAAGGKASYRWTFTVETGEKGTPGVGFLSALGLVALVALARRR